MRASNITVVHRCIIQKASGQQKHSKSIEFPELLGFFGALNTKDWTLVECFLNTQCVRPLQVLWALKCLKVRRNVYI